VGKEGGGERVVREIYDRQRGSIKSTLSWVNNPSRLFAPPSALLLTHSLFFFSSIISVVQPHDHGEGRREDIIEKEQQRTGNTAIN
jgi:hypothetical protein